MSASPVVHVRGGRHDRRDVPVTFEVDESVLPLGPEGGLAPVSGRKGGDRDKVLPAQRDGREVTFVLPRLKAGKELKLRPVDEVRAGASKKSRAELTESGDMLGVTLGGQPFGQYRFGESLARPHLWPLAGPGGTRMTRSWPIEPREGDREDHVHHKGLWVAHGLVNGTNNWSETEGHGFQVHKGFSRRVEGPVYAEFTSTNVWESSERKLTCEEDRTIRVMRLGDDTRLVDMTVRFRATEGELVFGDTKEGGICAVRVPTSMSGPHATIENCYGGLGEGECWGKAAHWVDYSGPADGGRRGIAILDHPMNLRHPTRWHVREYGLFAANPFALGAYKAGLDRDGSFTVEAGGELVFRYRVVLHKGDAEKGMIASRYLDWITPPEVEVTEG